MKKIVLLDKTTFPKSHEFSKPAFKHEWQEYEATSPEQTIANVNGAQIAITNKVKFPKEVLEQCEDLKLIAIAATGYDHIDLEAAREMSITVCNVRGYAVNSVPEHALMLMLALSRSVNGFRQEVINGRWSKEKQFCFFSHPIQDLHDKTLGIIGRGILGQGLARLAGSFGMGVIYAGRKGDKNPNHPYTEFNEFLENSDIISLHCPLNEDTKNLIAASEFAKMARKPIIINTARGGILNEEDTSEAIKNGQIRALGIDCLSKEPPEPDNPLLKIAHYPNVIVTPHIAWASKGAIGSLWHQVINNIEKFEKGTPENVIFG